MAELKDVYAKALLELSIEGDMLDASIKQAAIIRDALQYSHAQGFLAHPNIPDSAKKNFLRQLFESGVSGDLMGFLFLAVEKSREALILPSLQAFIDLGNRHKGKAAAVVVSAAELTDGQVMKLKALLSAKMDKQVDIVTRIDPAVIGGLYIHIEGRLMDLTVRTQLRNMKEIVRRGVSNDY